MKTKEIFYIVLILVFSINLMNAQETEYIKTAKNVLSNSLNVQKGEVVLIWSGRDHSDMAEIFATEATRLGAVAIPVILSDDEYKAMYKDQPDLMGGPWSGYMENWVKLVDVVIAFPTMDDPQKITEGISKENIEKFKEGKSKQNAIMAASNIRGCYIAGPNTDYAAYVVEDVNDFNNAYWNAVNTNYMLILDNAEKLENLLKNSKRIEISSGNGTEVSFTVNGRDAFIFDGVVDEEEANGDKFSERWFSLPEGNLFISAVENSANGKAVVPKDIISWKDKKMIEDISFKVNDGKISNLKIGNGKEAFMEIWNEIPDNGKYISGLLIGLNPNVKITDNKIDGMQVIAEGMVYIFSGHNENYGGKINAGEGKGYFFPIYHATLKVDGEVIIKDGKLIF